MVSETMKELKKEAKKLKIDFDKETTEAELSVLVSAAKAAAVAQAEKSGEVVPPPVTPSASTRSDVVEAQAKADEAEAAKTPTVTPAGDTLIGFVVTKANKVRHNLVATPEGKVQLKTVHGAVTAEFADEQEGKKHLENLSRF